MQIKIIIATLGLLASCSSSDLSIPSVPVAGAKDVRTSTDAKPIPKGGTTRERHITDEKYWYDGAIRRPLWLNAQVVAEFKPNDDARQKLLLATPAEPEPEASKSVRVWRVSSQIDSGELARGLNEQVQGASFSPVLQDAPTEHSSRRALVGGVIVTFASDWSRERIDAFLDRNGVVIAQPCGALHNSFVLQAPAGIAALDLANRLYETHEVVSSSPNWWLDMRAR